MIFPLGDNVERREFPLITIFLLVTNILVFACTYFLQILDDQNFTQTAAFFGKYGLSGQQLLAGKLTGIVSYMFLHGGLLHLLGNMIVLWAFGRTMENGLGRWKFFLFYMLFGAIAGLLHIVLHPNTELPLVGASGAVAGIIGGYTVAFGTRTKIKLFIFVGLAFFRIEMRAIWFALIYFGMQIAFALGNPEMVLVAWFAHVGGFVSGAVLMMFYRIDLLETLVVDAKGKMSISANPMSRLDVQ